MGRTSDAPERLIQAAMELMQARGFGAVSVSDICEAAGVNKGTFYHFFISKRHLALAAIEDYWQRQRAELFEPAFSAAHDPLDRINRLFTGFNDWLRADQAAGAIRGDLCGTLAMELAAQDPMVMSRLAEIFEEQATYFYTALAEAMADRPEDEARGQAEALLAYYHGLAWLGRTRNDLLELDVESILTVTGPSSAEE